MTTIANMALGLLLLATNLASNRINDIHLREVKSIERFLGIAPDFKSFLAIDTNESKARTIFDFETRAKITTLEWDKDWGSPKYASFSGSYIAVTAEGGGFDRTTIKIYRRKTHELIRNIRLDEILYYGVLSENDRYLVLVGNSLFIYDISVKSNLESLPAELYGRGSGAPAFAFSSNYQQLAFATGNGSKSYVSIVNLKPLIDTWKTFKHGVQGADKVKAGEMATQLVVQAHKDGTRAIAYSKDGKKLAVTFDDVVRVYDSKTGKLQVTLKGHLDTVEDVAFDPVGRLIATSGRDKTLRIWDSSKENTVELVKEKHDKSYARIIFSRDGKWIMLTNHSSSGVSRIWQVERK